MSPDLVATVRAVVAAGPHDPKRFRMTRLLWAIAALGGVALMVLLVSAFPMFGTNEQAGSKLGGFLLGLPILAIGGILYAFLRSWYERPIHVFDLPVVVELPGFAVWSQSDDMLVLAKQRAIALLVRAAPAPLSDVLATLDPTGSIQVVEENEVGTAIARLDIDLPGEVPLDGYLRRLWEGVYLLVLGTDREWDMLEDLDDSYLPRVRLRTPDEKPQKWRPLARVTIAQARVVR
jgi:hypothetical protein